MNIFENCALCIELVKSAEDCIASDQFERRKREVHVHVCSTMFWKLRQLFHKRSHVWTSNMYNVYTSIKGFEN